jgi:hypothetical protein
MSAQVSRRCPQRSPGRFILCTSPSSTGSPPSKKTIGMVAVAALAAGAEGRVVAAITSTRRWTKSAAIPRRLWAFCSASASGLRDCPDVEAGRSRCCPHELAIRLSRVLSADAPPQRRCLFQLLQLTVLLRNPFVQVLPLEIGKLGRKQSAFNVSPMAPHLGRIEVNHPPSPLWMFLSRRLKSLCDSTLRQHSNPCQRYGRKNSKAAPSR